MRRIAILGASGHGKVLADIAEICGFREVIFFDDAWPEKRQVGRWPVQGNSEGLLRSVEDFDAVTIGIGTCATRLQKYRALAAAGARLPVLKHPQTVLSTYARIGAASVLIAGAVVNIDAVVGAACIINTCATVDHDCVLHDGVHVAPGAHLSGGAEVGEGAWIGVGACVVQGLRIGKGVMVGAGAVVVHDVPDGVVVVGNPARIRKEI